MTFWYDKAAALLGSLYLLAVLGSRWTIFTIAQRLALCMTLPVYLSFFILPHFFERWYRNFRTPLILVLKVLLLLSSVDGKKLAHFQVRLNSAPQGLITDLVSAFIGAPCTRQFLPEL